MFISKRFFLIAQSAKIQKLRVPLTALLYIQLDIPTPCI